ncbi:hypothetical protein ACN58_26430 [Escherichia coli]|nr:hypothetical protein ACN58_26430 [Escherichia coli]
MRCLRILSDHSDSNDAQRRPDKALAPHPALLPNSSAAIMSDAILAHLIRPTPLVLLGAIF